MNPDHLALLVTETGARCRYMRGHLQLRIGGDWHNVDMPSTSDEGDAIADVISQGRLIQAHIRAGERMVLAGVVGVA